MTPIHILRRLWANGGRWLLVSVAIFLLAGALLAVAVTISILRQTPNPLRFESPQKVTGASLIENHAGGMLTITAVKCNDGDAPLLIQGFSYYKTTEGPYRTIANAINTTGNVIEPHSCHTQTFSNPLPATMTPGHWRLEGQSCTAPDHKFCQTWFTQDFEVTP